MTFKSTTGLQPSGDEITVLSKQWRIPKGAVVAELKTESLRLGIPYQTLISSILHRYVKGELIDKKTVELAKQFKDAS